MTVHMFPEWVGKLLTNEERRDVINGYRFACTTHLRAIKSADHWSRVIKELYKDFSDQFTTEEKRELIAFLNSEKCALGALVATEETESLIAIQRLLGYDKTSGVKNA